MDERNCLAADPFAGDFGGDDRTLKDKMVNARKEGPCHHCAQTIRKGERIRSRADVSDGDLMTFRWCNACCVLMANDDHEALEARLQLREPQP